MAIKIPSKNIYNIENPKIRDNFIDYVEVKTQKVLPNNTNKKNVFNENFNKGFYEDKDIRYSVKGHNVHTINSSEDIYKIEYAYAELTPIYIKIDEITIPIKGEQSFVSRLVLQETLDENTYAVSSYSVYGTKNTGVLNQTFFMSYTGNPFNSPNFNFINREEVPEASGYSEYISPTDLDQLFSKTEAQGNASADLSTNTILTNRTNLNSITYTTVVEEDCYKIKNIILLAGAIYIGGTFVDESAYLPTNSGSKTYESDMTIPYVRYTPEYIQLSIFGNTVGIKIEETTLHYGKGNKPYSLKGNEILQDTTTTNNEPTSEVLANNILNQYKNGRETATLLCDISDYYNEYGVKVIGIDKVGRMSFRHHDIVIPYVYGVDEKDIPMSRYSSGNPKKFEVVSVKKFYDGAIWQSLELLEVLEEVEG